MIENIEVFTQSSIRIKGQTGTVYVDPFKMRAKPHDADYVLITHDHYDHFSPEDIEKVVSSGTVLIVPEKMKSKAKDVSSLVKEIHTVKPGERQMIGTLGIETVPAYNLIKPFHPKGAGWVGYILDMDGSRIYVAGDTDATKEAGNVKCDIALVPIGGTYTMDARKAAELINTMKPSVAIPTHYGSIVGRPADADVFKECVKEPVRVEVKMQY